MRTDKGNILLVEDDVNLGSILEDFLVLEGYSITRLMDGKKGLAKFKKESFDLCILDVMLPQMDGFTLATEIRKINDDTPIIFLTAKSMKADRIKGLKIGADDYITKPFSTEELILRIDAILKRIIRSSSVIKTNIYKLGSYSFDSDNQILKSDLSERSLTKTESKVLSLLCEYKGNLVKRDTVLKEVWGDDDYFKGRSMDVYITKLRKYISEDDNVKITNVHGSGFKLEITE